MFDPIMNTFNTTIELYNMIKAFELLYGLTPIIKLNGYIRNKLTQELVPVSWIKVISVQKKGFQIEGEASVYEAEEDTYQVELDHPLY
jgi:hypothetical protein